MKNKIYFHLPAIIFGVLVVSFLAAFYIFAWTEPTEVPPGGNVPAPINVGSISQIKEGGLGVYGVFRAVGGADPAVESGLVVNNGNVGIGTTGPAANTKLHVVGASDDFARGILGESAGNLGYGVLGRATGTGGSGVAGYAPAGYGVYGSAETGTGGWFRSTSGYGLIVERGNVGIGTTNPGERLDLGGGNIAMGYQVVINDCNVFVAANLGQMCYVYCPAGKRVIGGGCWILDTPGNTSGTLQNSHPIDNNTGWACAYSNIRTDPGVMRVEAICANMR